MGTKLMQIIQHEMKLCYEKIGESLNLTVQGNNLLPANMCGIAWDNLLCWEHTPAGTLATQPCPYYVAWMKGNATRNCTEDATWYVNPVTNRSWTNVSDCTRSANLPDLKPVVNPDEMKRVQVIYQVGYGLSLVALIIALSIMVFCRRLHCKSNTLHINLFIAFILRASVSFIRDWQLLSMLTSLRGHTT